MACNDPRLHYSCIDEGLYWMRDFMVLTETTIWALGDGDTGGNMDPEQWRGLGQLLRLLSNTLEQIHKDYQAQCEHCRCGR